MNVNAFTRGALTILNLGLLVLSPFSIANAGTGNVTVENLRGPLVNAWFSATDPSGCIQTDTFVTANRPTDQLLPGAGTTTGIGAVSIFEYDSCTDTSLLQAVGQTDTLGAADLQISRQLDWASLHTTITVTNIDTGDAFDVNVNIAWVGTSDITRDHSDTNDLYPAATSSTAGRALAATRRRRAVSLMALRISRLPHRSSARSAS